MTFFSWLASVFAKSFFDFIKGLIEGYQTRMRDEELGRQKQINETNHEMQSAKKKADEKSLAPADRETTMRRIEDGSY